MIVGWFISKVTKFVKLLFEKLLYTEVVTNERVSWTPLPLRKPDWRGLKVILCSKKNLIWIYAYFQKTFQDKKKGK